MIVVSHLFEAITALPEYYPTRTEQSILTSAIQDIVALGRAGSSSYRI